MKEHKIIPADRERILVIMLDYHLGDFVVSLPVIEALADYFDHGIDLAVFHSHASLVRLLPSQSKIRVLPYVTEKKKRDLRQHVNFLKLIGQVMRRRFQAVFTISGRSPCATLALLSLARVRIGTPCARTHFGFNDVPPPKDGGHRLDDFTPVLTRIGIEGRPPICKLVVPQTALDRAQALAQENEAQNGFAVIHATAGKACRQWPAERFAAIADELITRWELAVFLVGTPNERDYLEALQKQMTAPPHAAPIVTESLDVTLALLKTCRLFVCNFSGPTHLAGLTTDAPIVCISGPTNKHYWGLLNNPNATLISGPICETRCKKDNCTIGFRCVRDVSIKQVSELIESHLTS